METIDCVVVGAGVVGLACARSLALSGREVLILESENDFGTGISARNSEVIHAGLYYPPGSLKARLCLAGRDMLYRYCRERGVPHRRTGKLVVAAHPGQQSALEALATNARRNGVTGLRLLDASALARLEPALYAHSALYSPDTGIIDSHQLMLALLADGEAAGAILATNSALTAGKVTGHGIELDIVSGGESLRLRSQWLVNAAGLSAHAVAGCLEGLGEEHTPRQWYARGDYFTYSGKAPFSHLIYPLPEPGGLGVHLTLDMAGQARFGPDVTWLDAPDFQVDAGKAAAFARSISSWWPEIDAERLSPGYAGVRPKLSGPGEPDSDFRIDGPRRHGVPGLVNLFGIESPGLTSCLTIARQVIAELGLGD